MARQYQIPGGPYINETATRQYQIPGGPYVNETVAAAGGAADIVPLYVQIGASGIQAYGLRAGGGLNG